MAIKLYSWPRSSGTRVTWVLEELGVPYEYIELDRAKGEHKQPAFLALNPNAKVPALVDDGVSYFESLAITLYLAERYGVERGLWPSSGQDRADALSWSVWSVVELAVYLSRYFYHGADTPISYKPEDRSKAAAEFNLACTTKNLAMLDNRLAERGGYILGKFSLVDTLAGSTVRFGTMFGIKLDKVPNVATWHDELSKRPAVMKTR